MREALLVATARTPITKAGRGELNVTPGAQLAAHVINCAVERAGIDPALVEDVLLGCGYPEGTTGRNIARQAVIRAGLPLSVAGAVVSRFCASGLHAVAHAAARVVMDGSEAMVAGGVESVSQLSTRDEQSGLDPWLVANKPELYLPMIETADIVALRYGIGRGRQDAFALESQRRTAFAQAAGYMSAEIAPITTKMRVIDEATGEARLTEVTAAMDSCNRPGTTAEGLTKLAPVRGPDQFVTAGNASQLADGAAACVLMSSDAIKAAGVEPLGAFRSFAVAGCEPDEMGIGPIFAVPKLLERAGLKVDDIDLWELNEAFASQAIYCADRLGIDPEKLNVSGGSIAIGHPFGMTGARQVGHLLVEGRRRNARYVVASMCVAGGMGAAGLIELY